MAPSSAMDLACRDCGGRALAQGRRGPVRYWRCDGCGACALTDGALRRLLPEGAWGAVWPALRDAAAHGANGCPSCGRPMDQSAPIEAAAGRRLDFCEPCRVVWLDPGEFDDLPKAPVPPAEPELPPEVRRAIADAEVALIRMRYDLEEERILGPFREIAGAIFAAFLHFRPRR